ncbi:MAG: methyltransferase domain-containing protein [Firmicutes bacterium]|nr:methyltransferase domain-containing protein [Dethiobacter sp.]MBS3888492.1 methyltransferase domain-containing protein [Bacillota bacterium]
MSQVEEKLAKSLTAESTELIPYLPYLLQDLWELGSSPKDIIEIIERHVQVSRQTKVLDLACGKGAVSVRLAEAFGCRVKGIDIMPEFIAFANKKANEYGLESLCEFQVGDINEFVMAERDYDLVVFGAAGDVLGGCEEAIRKLKSTVKGGGYIVLDDAYAKEEVLGKYLARNQWLMFLQNAGVSLLDEKFTEDEEMKRLNEWQQACIVARATELQELYPEKAALFASYIRSQQDECDELENEIAGVLMIIRT